MNSDCLINKITVDFFPYSGGDNPYIDILRAGVEKVGDCKIRQFNISISKYLFYDKETDIVYLNWYDNVQNNTRLRTLYSIIKRLLLLYIIKFKKIKIFIVIHNRVPHNARNISLLKWYMSRLFLIADRLPVLSKGTLEIVEETFGHKIFERIKDKFILIPVTNYIDVYSRSGLDIFKRHNIKKDSFVYLFWGSIEPYKNVEVLITAACNVTKKFEQTYFLIAGNCSDKYEKTLRNLIGNNKRIVLIPNKIKDCELADYISESSIVVAPIDMYNSMNSGTCFVTFSLGKTIICSRIAGIKDFDNQVFFDYTYKNKEEHEIALYTKCVEAYKEFKQDPEKFINRGELIKNELYEKYSKEVIGKVLSDEFVKCVKQEY